MKFAPLLASKIVFLCLVALALISGACISPKKEARTPVLLKTENSSQAHLMSEVDRLAKVHSMKAGMDLKFEDNSWA
jgi:hypothetical protein